MSRKTWLLGGIVALVVGVVPPCASAADERIALGEVYAVASAPPGVDPASIKSAAEGEIRSLDASRVKRKVVVSVAVTSASDAPVEVGINATIRDSRTGAMIAIVEGRARSEGGGNVELRRAVLRAAVRTAVQQIPKALSGS